MTEDEFYKLARLCRISCTGEEKEKLLKNIQETLKYVDQLKEVNTDGILPCCSVSEAHHPLREDVPGEVLERALFLENAPAHTGGMVRVPPVIKQ